MEDKEEKKSKTLDNIKSLADIERTTNSANPEAEKTFNKLLKEFKVVWYDQRPETKEKIKNLRDNEAILVATRNRYTGGFEQSLLQLRIGKNSTSIMIFDETCKDTRYDIDYSCADELLKSIQAAGVSLITTSGKKLPTLKTSVETQSIFTDLHENQFEELVSQDKKPESKQKSQEEIKNFISHFTMLKESEKNDPLDDLPLCEWEVVKYLKLSGDQAILASYGMGIKNSFYLIAATGEIRHFYIKDKKVKEKEGLPVYENKEAFLSEMEKQYELILPEAIQEEQKNEIYAKVKLGELKKEGIIFSYKERNYWKNLKIKQAMIVEKKDTLTSFYLLMKCGSGEEKYIEFEAIGYGQYKNIETGQICKNINGLIAILKPEDCDLIDTKGEKVFKSNDKSLEYSESGAIPYPEGAYHNYDYHYVLYSHEQDAKNAYEAFLKDEAFSGEQELEKPAKGKKNTPHENYWVIKLNDKQIKYVGICYPGLLTKDALLGLTLKEKSSAIRSGDYDKAVKETKKSGTMSSLINNFALRFSKKASDKTQNVTQQTENKYKRKSSG